MSIVAPKPRYDAVLVLSFGGPDKSEDVIPFLENVLRGRNVPRARLEEVAEHYYHFGGKSPINGQCLALISALREELDEHGPRLPIYWGNRNWHPMVEDTMKQMARDGVRRALVFATSAWSSYSSCRQYREDLDRAIGATGPGAPVCEKLRHFYRHPGFIEVMAGRVRESFEQLPPERRAAAHLLFTAHSIPLEMANQSRYVEQLETASRLTAEMAGISSYRLVYQSRSGPPHQPWLEPDILKALEEIAGDPAASRDVVVSPIGFISDHMEVLYDLDTEAAKRAAELGLNLVRSGTAGTHPRFIRMIRELIEERMENMPDAEPCLENCCPAPIRRPSPQADSATPRRA
jgi:ferrochelatase